MDEDVGSHTVLLWPDGPVDAFLLATLLEAGAPVSIGARPGTRLTPLERQRAVTVRPEDLDPWPSSLADADRVVAAVPRGPGPDARALTHVVEAAIEAGVAQVVLVSRRHLPADGRAPRPAPPSRTPRHLAVVRYPLTFQEILGTPNPACTDHLHLPAVGWPVPAVDARDVADVLACLLTGPSPVDRQISIRCTDVLTEDAVVLAVSSSLGHRVAARPSADGEEIIPFEAFGALCERVRRSAEWRRGLPSDVPLDALLGRPATTFSAFAAQWVPNVDRPTAAGAVAAVAVAGRWSS